MIRGAGRAFGPPRPETAADDHAEFAYCDDADRRSHNTVYFDYDAAMTSGMQKSWGEVASGGTAPSLCSLNTGFRFP